MIKKKEWWRKKKELANIIRNQNIINRKQKIFNIKNQTIFGYESLNRGPENSIYSNPLTLIDEAKVTGLLWAFENVGHREKEKKLLM